MRDHLSAVFDVWDRQLMLGHKPASLLPAYHSPPLSEVMPGILPLQCMDEKNSSYGAIINMQKGFAEPGTGSSYVFQLLFAYYSKASRFFRDERLLARAKLAMAFQLEHTHADGSSDLLETNFHCASTTAFIMHMVGYAHKLIGWFGKHTPVEDELEVMLVRYAHLAGEAMLTLGFHTPNHRWVQSAALALCHSITRDARCLAYIKQFLAEGNDCDEEGEYAERSAGIYNIVSNNALILLAHELAMPELLAYVERNLKMSTRYFEPDGTICTMNSTRQDMGKDITANAYYETLLYMAIKTGDGQLAGAADELYQRFFYTDHWSLGCYMGMFLLMLEDQKSPDGFELSPALAKKAGSLTGLSSERQYDKHYPKSGIARLREGDTTLTLVQNAPIFLKLQNGRHRLYLRFAGAYYGPLAQFKADSLERTKSGYRLFAHKRWGYKRALDTPQATSDWEQMDHSLRAEVGMEDFDVAIDVAFDENGVWLDIETLGVAHIPYKLEIMSAAGGWYETRDTILNTRPGDYAFLREGRAEYLFAPDGTGFAVDGGFAAHHYAANMRGAMPADEKMFSVVLADFTPGKKRIRIDAVSPSAEDFK